MVVGGGERGHLAHSDGYQFFGNALGSVGVVWNNVISNPAYVGELK